MSIRIEEISPHNQQDLNRIDSTFTIDSVLDIAATDFGNKLSFISVPPYEKHYPPDTFDVPAYIGSRDRVIYLAYMDGKIAGQIVVKRNWNRLALVEDIAVDRSMFRLRIGTALMDHAAKWSRDNGFPAMMLETQDTNAGACRFYHAYGFKIGGYDRHLYSASPAYRHETAVFWYYFL